MVLKMSYILIVKVDPRVYIFQNPSPAQLKCIHLITYKLYFNNFD